MVSTGIEDDKGSELKAYFRQMTNIDKLDISFGKSLTDVIFNMFLRFSSPIEVEVDGKVKKIMNIKQLAALPANAVIEELLAKCVVDITKEIETQQDEAVELLKK